MEHSYILTRIETKLEALPFEIWAESPGSYRGQRPIPSVGMSSPTTIPEMRTISDPLEHRLLRVERMIESIPLNVWNERDRIRRGGLSTEECYILYGIGEPPLQSTGSCCTVS